MPSHSTPKSHSGAAAPKTKKTASSSSAGGGEGAAVTRSAVTGRQLGKAAVRSLNKNAEAAQEYLDSIEEVTSLSDLQALAASAMLLARVARPLGAGRLAVQLQTGGEPVDVPIGGNVRFKGRAGTKTDRANCMCANDIILVRGGLAAAKLSPAAASRVKRVFTKHGLSVPAGFFALGAADAHDGAEGGFDFDRSEEESEEAELEAERVAEEGRRARVKSGGAARGGRSLGGAGRALVADALDAIGADADENAEEAGLTLEEAEARAARNAAKAVVREAGALNRAERRAAAASAAAAAAASASAADASAFALYGDADEEAAEAEAEAAAAYRHQPKPTKGWEELADEIDIDAI